MRNPGMPFVLAQHGRPACAICHEPSGPHAPLAPIRALVACLKQLSGVTLPVYAGAAPGKLPVIRMGILSRCRSMREMLARDQILLAGAAERPARLAVLSNLTLFPDDLGEQGFLVYGTREQGRPALVVAANTGQGLDYAVQTLKQRIYREGGAWRIFGLGTRFLPVLHRPAFETRSLATFISGPCYLYPGQWEKEFGGDYKRFIDWMAEHKLNHLLDWSFTPDAGIGYRSKRFPELVNKLHPNVRHEYMPGMLRYARQRHIKTWLFFKLPFLDYAGNKSGAHCPPVGEDRPIVSAVRTAADAMRRGQSLRMVCLSRPQTRKFWRQYIAELLKRYPGIDGLGCEVGEHLASYCACPACKGREQELGYEYFKIMAGTARKINPALKLWFYRAAGAARIAERRSEFGDVTMIGWGFTQFWGPRRSIPRGDWFLCHTGTEEHAEAYLHQAIDTLSRNKFDGIQIRGTKYMEWESKYRAFDEFTWNPDLSLDDFAILNAIRQERQYDGKLIDIYRHWMRLVAADRALTFQHQNRFRLPDEWLAAERYAMRRKIELAALPRLLAQYRGKSSQVQHIADELRRLLYSFRLLAGEFTVKRRATASDDPWPGILTLRPGGYGERSIRLPAGIYTATAVMKNTGAEPCKVGLQLNGRPATEFAPELLPTGGVSWHTLAAQFKAVKPGAQRLRLHLLNGDACAIHRIVIAPETRPGPLPARAPRAAGGSSAGARGINQK